MLLVCVADALALVSMVLGLSCDTKVLLVCVADTLVLVSMVLSLVPWDTEVLLVDVADAVVPPFLDNALCAIEILLPYYLLLLNIFSNGYHY